MSVPDPIVEMPEDVYDASADEQAAPLLDFPGVPMTQRQPVGWLAGIKQRLLKCLCLD